MNKLRMFFNVTIACLFIYCLNILYYGSSIESLYGNYNILTIPVICGLVFLLQQNHLSYCKLSRRRWIFLFCSLLLSTFFVLGTRIMINGFIVLSDFFIYLCILIFTIIILSILTLIYTKVIPSVQRYFNQPHPIIDTLVTKLTFPIIWIFIFICWIPILLACYPGIFSYDAIYQCSQVTDTLNLNTHHPIIHTLLLGGCVQLGRSLFHSANAGMLLYSLLQMLINSCIFAYIITFLKKQHTSTIGILACLFFFALMPFNSILAICATKDTIFSALFALLFTFLYNLVFDPDQYFSSWKNLLFFSFIAFLAIAFRNNMLYAFILCIPFLLLFYRKYWKKMLIMLLLPLILFKLYEGLLYPSLNVTSGDSREAYSVIMQQYANVYNNCELDSNDKEMLLLLMDDDAWSKYEPHKSDIIKNEFNTQIFEANLMKYVKLYVKLGLHYPSQYINAFLNLTYGYWYPNDLLPDNTTYRKYIEVYTGGDITFESKIPWLLEKLKKIGMDSSYQSIPGFSMLFSPAFYIWSLIFITTICIYEKKYKFLTLMLLPCTFLLSILFGPVALLRYAYPVILCTPMALLLYPRIVTNDIHNA